MSKLDSKPMQHAQNGMTPHNLSHTFDFTSSTGMILPLVCDLLNPGEKIETIIDLSDTRTQPMQSAAYLDLDMHVDYFFVPMTLLMSKFESFIYRINDFYSSAGYNAPFNLPLLDLDTAKSFIRAGGGNYPWSSIDFDQYAKGSLRLFDHLKYGTLFNSVSDANHQGGPTEAYNPSIFPWALLAYNACYMYHYINDEFEEFNNRIFNVDDYVNSGTAITNFFGSSLAMATLKYRNKYHDYFTSVKASPIVSGKNLLDSAGSLSLAKSWLSRELVGNNTDPILIDGSIGSSGFSWNDAFTNAPDTFNSNDVRSQFGLKSNTHILNATDYVSLHSPDVNTANLRALFANEKLWTITGLNRKQYDAQTLAHFGYDVPVDVMHQVQHIGHHVYNLRVGEVIATAGTTQNPLATVAGKGYGFRNPENKPVKFTAPCHGIYIALYSSAIKRNYCNTFGKENAVAGWQDFYQPEFDHLGMQPMFAFEALQDDLSNQNGGMTVSKYANILGWQYRYEQFKRRYNRSSLAFANQFEGAGNVYFSGPFASWSPSDVPLDYYMVTGVSLGFDPNSVDYLSALKESPNELNNMMLLSYDPKWHDGSGTDPLNYVEEPYLAYQTDPLVHHSKISYSKLSTMSAYSMPRLDA